MGQLTVDSGQLTAEEQVEASLLQVHCELQDKIMKGMDSRFDDLREAYNTLQHVCRSVARCEGKSAAEWRDVAVAHQAALVETTATMNRYHGDWEKAVAQVQQLQGDLAGVRLERKELGNKVYGLERENKNLHAVLAAHGWSENLETGEERVVPPGVPSVEELHAIYRAGWAESEQAGVVAVRDAVIRGLGAPESVRVDEEKRRRLNAEEQVLKLEAEVKLVQAESSRTIAHLKDQWVEARELLSSNFSNERAGLHEQLAELRARNEELQKGAAELLAGVEVVAGATGPVADALRRQLAAAKGEEVLTRPGAPAATDGTDNTDGVVVEGGVV